MAVWSPRAEGSITARDGRVLAYAERGPVGGVAVLAFHGTPGSRLEQHAPSETYDRLGIRLITVERPGMGRSDPDPGRRVLEGPDDVVDLAHALGFGRFFLLGYSGGAPYAAACAHRLGDQVAAVGLVSPSAKKPPPGDHTTTPEDPEYADGRRT